jgi:hypothetical protein
MTPCLLAVVHGFIFTAIRDTFHQEGELSAAIEVRRRFPLIRENGAARLHARTIAGWTQSLPAPKVIRLRPD